MAVPTTPTLISITEEALKQAGYSNPTGTSLLTRAQDEWMAEIKNDIYIRQKKLKSLETSSVLILEEGKSRYSLPTDYGDKLSFNLLNGSTSGTAQAGTANTLTLEAATSLGSDIIGRKILITDGAAIGSMSQCVSYDDTTKIATVSPNFAVTPGADGYLIVSNHDYLVESPVWDFDRLTHPTIQGAPTHFALLGDSDNGEISLYPVPYTSDNGIFGLELRYYADLQELDLAGSLITTLYKKYRNVFTSGLKWRAFANDDDNRADKEFVNYQTRLNEMISRETVGLDVDNLNMTVQDY